VGSGSFRRFRLAYDVSELFRRYFINTLFDSTFVVLGIVSATVVVTDTPIEVTLGALSAACIAIGISTGVSVYEAERLEAKIRMAKIERAMLADLQDTHIDRTLTLYRTFVSIVNFCAPLLVFGVTSLPFLLHLGFGVPSLQLASQLSILLAILLVFLSGVALGRLAEGNPIRQGLRMTIAALATFIILVFVQTIVL
jgi:predicted membrane protein (TIGR00267 family)